MGNPILIAPSILSADFGQLGDGITKVGQAGADWIHVDVMDGHFVPNLTIGPPVIRALRKTTELPFDVHLMIESPERSIDQYVASGANGITVHVETCPHLHRTLAYIRSCGVQANVALNPSTPASVVEHVLEIADMVLVMTVNPGFGGQSFIAGMLAKIAEIRAMADAKGIDSLRIQVDGGIGPGTVSQVTQAGADVLVAGSAIFTSPNFAETIANMRKEAQ